MKATINDFGLLAREPQSASVYSIHSSKRLLRVATLPVVPPWSACGATVLAREAAGARVTNVPAASLWRQALAGRATDRMESVAYLLLAVSSAVSLLNGFWHLDNFLSNWTSF